MTIKTLYNNVYKIGLFTTEHSKYNSVGSPIGNPIVDEDYVGWLELTGNYMPVSTYDIKDVIREKSSMTFTLGADHLWYLNCDIICKFDNSAFYPKSADNQPIDTGSRLFVQINGTDDTVGTVTIEGTTTEVGSGDTETVVINGEGLYLTTKTFESIDANGVDANGLNCVVSVWGDIGLRERRREIQFYVDGNEDDIYALLFSGTIYNYKHSHSYNNDIITVVAYDYTEMSMSTDFNNYNSPYRCTHYSIVGANGMCLQSNTNFGDGCKWGDMGPYHPNGVAVTSTIHRCNEYSPDYNHPYPWDGYTYSTGYAPDTEYGYEYYPKDYTRALRAQATVHNQLDRLNRPFDHIPAVKATFTLNSGMSNSVTSISFDNYYGTGLEEGDYIIIGDEFMKVTSSPMVGTSYYENHSSSFIEVERGNLNSLATSHLDDTRGYLYYVSTAVQGVTHDTIPVLLESDVSDTIYNTGAHHAETMTEHFGTREVVYWIDYHRQHHFSEMNMYDPSYSSSLELTDDDVLAVSDLGFGDVINHVTGVVDTHDGKIRCEMSANEVTGMTNSITRFGRNTSEMNTSHLNAVGNSTLGNANPEDDRRGFYSMAWNYLLTHSYPIVKQTVKLIGFYPDEMYWTNDNIHTRLNYTDPLNKYIDIKGHTLKCKDYNFEARPIKTWTVEGLRYKANEYGDAFVYVSMSRLTDEDDFIGVDI